MLVAVYGAFGILTLMSMEHLEFPIWLAKLFKVQHSKMSLLVFGNFQILASWMPHCTWAFRKLVGWQHLENFVSLLHGIYQNSCKIKGPWSSVIPEVRYVLYQVLSSQGLLLDGSLLWSKLQQSSSWVTIVFRQNLWRALGFWWSNGLAHTCVSFSWWTHLLSQFIYVYIHTFSFIFLLKMELNGSFFDKEKKKRVD